MLKLGLVKCFDQWLFQGQIQIFIQAVTAEIADNCFVNRSIWKQSLFVKGLSRHYPE